MAVSVTRVVKSRRPPWELRCSVTHWYNNPAARVCKKTVHYVFMSLTCSLMIQASTTVFFFFLMV